MRWCAVKLLFFCGAATSDGNMEGVMVLRECLHPPHWFLNTFQQCMKINGTLAICGFLKTTNYILNLK